MKILWIKFNNFIKKPKSKPYILVNIKINININSPWFQKLKPVWKNGGGVTIKIKEIIIICLILCFIFSLQAVVAADVDADDTNGTALATADTDVV